MLYFAPWKTTVILVLIVLGVIFAVPNFVPQKDRFETDPVTNALRIDPETGQPRPIGIWRFIPNKSLNLGLDLRGGSQLLYEVDLSSVRRNELEGALERAATIARDTGCADEGTSREGLFCPVLTD